VSGKIPILTGRGDFQAAQITRYLTHETHQTHQKGKFFCEFSIFALLSSRTRRGESLHSGEESLDHCGPRKHFTLPFFHNPGDWINRPYPCLMSKVCSITGSRVTRGSVIHRRGMAKKKGGVGRHVTKNVRREFHPNLHEHRVWVPELKKFVRIRVTARGLKTINKNGAYRALKKAGVIAS
jgi:large subunit ribosomal protein L28